MDENSQAVSSNQPSPKVNDEGILRPGISAEMLGRAGVKRVNQGQAQELCGLEASGLWLPYRTLGGEAIVDSGKAYGRLRLAVPEGSRKYHQSFGTGVHAYLPPGLVNTAPGGDLALIEGEFKSLALMEAGFAAIGISGFFGGMQKGGEELVPELREAITRLKPARVLFCGDSDTALNYQFAVAAVRTAKHMAPTSVVLPRISLSAPGKGADDCRESFGPSFPEWWRDRIGQAVLVDPDMQPALLAVELFEGEHGAIQGLKDAARYNAHRRMLKLAAALKGEPLLQDRVTQFAVRKLGYRRHSINRALKSEEKELVRPRGNDEEANGAEIEHHRPAAIWTQQVWQAVGGDLYRYAGQLCRFHDGRLQPQSPAELVSFLDNPERCQFMSQSRGEELVMSSFTEADARVFIGSWMNALDIVRTVEVFSNVPVLAWDGKGPVLVTGYDKNLQIMAGGEQLNLSAPAEAVEILIDLLKDYDFVTPGDLGRAVALFLSPALAQGGFLGKGRVPLVLIEKNEVATGGSLLLRLVSQVYGLRPQPITKLDKPEKVMEDISRTLLSGAGFIYFDNARGRGLQHLPELESLLTEPVFNCRAPYLHGEADVTKRVLAVSSNGAVFSRDLASRTVKVTIRKRPEGYAFASYVEGSIEDHVAINRNRYLGAVFSLVNDWAAAGRPAGEGLTGFRFGQWERACAWILQKHFPGLPLLDQSHQEAQDRLADPDHDMLRSLFRLVLEGETRGELTASSLAEIGAEAGLLHGDEQQNRLRVGKAMKRRFPRDDDYLFDSRRFAISRVTRKSPTGNGHDIAFYEVRVGDAE